MASRRSAAKSAYERRIERYLKAHPGASRSEARGHRKGEYRRRVEGTEPGSEERQIAAGKRGRSSFLDYIHQGDEITLATHISSVTRGGTGRFSGIEKLVVPADPKRPTRHFVINSLTSEELERMIEAEIEAGGLLTPTPSRDQRRLVSGRA